MGDRTKEDTKNSRGPEETASQEREGVRESRHLYSDEALAGNTGSR